ncbi:unnamed protein product [Linum tenue]|uniref:Lysosomal beta A mannosidase n=1 Tax=Linum tenue TaxID=586396 RepID=A0AAV0R0M0_9ROSI|nr:unnamed protein product [Linum tenue]
MVVAVGKRVLDSGWIAARSTEVKLTGIQLTTTNPPSVGPKSPWMEAVVPGSVLATLVKNKVVPDPFYGLENEAILDIADSGRDYYTYWFFTTFDCKLSANQFLDLNFRGVNYSAEVYLNGHQKLLPKGMFRRHSLDVTSILNSEGSNLLAVLVHPPDHPGKIPPEGGQGGDHEIGKDVTTQYVEGWDWICPIRDRNTGIWDEVSILVTGPVKIIDPHLVSTFYDNYTRVYLEAAVELENRSSTVAGCTVNIQVTTELEGDVCLVEHLQTQYLAIAAGKCVKYTFPQLFFYKPNLWWPNGMGKQALYNVTITANIEGHGESDTWNQLFGFRKIESSIDKNTGGRLFRVNGKPIFIRGGNWIVSDGLLRLSRKRYETDIKFHADMNFNMIRCWGGGVAERPDFYHYCDIYGILVWQEFWITGDVDGRGVPVSNPNGPLDHDLFLFCARDTVKLLRNHPSLALWVGGNEQVPPPDINNALKKDLQLMPHFQTVIEGDKKLPVSTALCDYLDGTRIYIQGSMWDGFADGQGNFTDGPYEIQYPESFFKDDFYKYGFNPEVGSVGMPVAATIRATMPIEGWQIPLFNKVADGYVEEVPNPIWTYHKYIPYSKPGKVHDQILLYSLPTDLDDFCLKAQLVNYIQYRALLEGYSSHMWSKYTASVWDLEGTSPYYKVYEDLSIPSKKTTRVAEMKYPKCKNPKPAYFLLLKLYNKSDYSILSRNFYWLHLPGGDYKSLEPFRKKKIPLKLTTQTFISGTTYEMEVLVQNRSKKPDPSRHLTDQNNFITKIQHKAAGDDYDANSELQQNEHDDGTRKGGFFRSLSRIFFSETDGNSMRVCEVNGSDIGVAFFIHFSVHAANAKYQEGEDTRILPVHYSDNYFSLVPGEQMRIKLSFEVPPGVTPRVTLHGWNYPGGHAVHH